MNRPKLRLSCILNRRECSDFLCKQTSVMCKGLLTPPTRLFHILTYKGRPLKDGGWGVTVLTGDNSWGASVYFCSPSFKPLRRRCDHYRVLENLRSHEREDNPLFSCPNTHFRRPVWSNVLDESSICSIWASLSCSPLNWMRPNEHGMEKKPLKHVCTIQTHISPWTKPCEVNAMFCLLCFTLNIMQPRIT